MSDFEDRLTRALAEGAEDAPDATGTADAARRRSRARRRRVVAGGAVAAVVAVLVPVGIVVEANEEPDSGRVVAEPDPGWKTAELPGLSYVEREEPVPLLVDVPEDWVQAEADDCPALLWAPPGAKECTEGLSIYGGATFDALFGPGLRPASDYDYDVEADWLGYVDRGNSVVFVASDDAQVARRILGSARSPGDAIPDLSGEWAVVVENGVTYRAPPLDDGQGLGVQVTDRGGRDDVAYGEEAGPGRWEARMRLDNGRGIQVTAPTQALAELLAGSARVAEDGATAPDILRVETWRGARIEVPASWVNRDPCSGAGSGVSEPVVVRLPEFGNPDCPVPEGLGVTFFDGSLYDSAMPYDEMIRSAGVWVGQSVVKTSIDVVVFVRSSDRATGQAVIDSLRRVR